MERIQSLFLKEEDPMYSRSACLIYAVIIVLLFAVQPLAKAGFAQTSMPEEKSYNEKGLKYFKTGYYEMAPKHRKNDAAEQYLLAEEEFKKAIAINEEYLEAHVNLARLYYIQKKYEKASAEYGKVVELDPWNIDHYVNLAVTLTELGKFDEAMQILEEAKTRTTDAHALRQLDKYMDRINEDNR